MSNQTCGTVRHASPGGPGRLARPAVLLLSGFMLTLVLGKRESAAVDGQDKGRAPQNQVAQSIAPVAPPQFCWVRNSAGPGSDAGYAIALDKEGNSLVTGVFEGVARFGDTNLSSQGALDIFVAKYNPKGEILWVRQAGGANQDAALGIALDGQNHIYLTGYFSGSAEFDDTTLTSAGATDLFVVKYSPEGNVVWAATSGGSDAAFGSAIAVDNDGNCYVTGGFSLSAVFGEETFRSAQSSDAFVAKFDAMGTLLWAKQFGGDGADQGTGIACRPTNGCYVTGYFELVASFSGEKLGSFGNRDLFLCQLDGDGKLQWIRQAGGTGKTQSAAVGVDRAGNSWVTGYYETATFFNTTRLETDGFFDLFLAKYSPTGDILWARKTGSSYAINATGVATDAGGNSYITGSFAGRATFHGATLTNNTASGIFVAKYDTDGGLVWARQAGIGEGASAAFGLAADRAGSCWLVGRMTGVADFDGTVLVSGDKPDVLVAKLPGSAGAATNWLRVQRALSNQLEIQFLADPCGAYRLETSPDLQQWSNVLKVASPEGPVTAVETIDGQARARFYRVASP